MPTRLSKTRKQYVLIPSRRSLRGRSNSPLNASSTAAERHQEIDIWRTRDGLTLFTVAATFPPVRAVSESTASTPVVVVLPVVSTTTVPTWTSTTPVTSVRLVCDTSTSSRTTSGSPSSTSTSCGPSSPSRPVTPTSLARRRTPSPSSTSSPSATPRSSARAASPKSPWSSARGG